MSQWQMIFAQSKVNDAIYNGDILPAQNLKWPEGTWFQKRLQASREAQALTLQSHLDHLVLRSGREDLQPTAFRHAA